MENVLSEMNLESQEPVMETVESQEHIEETTTKEKPRDSFKQITEQDHVIIKENWDSKSSKEIGEMINVLPTLVNSIAFQIRKKSNGVFCQLKKKRKEKSETTES